MRNFQAIDLIGVVLASPTLREGSEEEEMSPSVTVRITPPSPVEPAVWGPLRIKAKIGEGGFGEVFLAHDPGLEKDVALKLRRRDLSGSQNDLFLVEARKLARVRHPNILTVHGVANHDGRTGLWADHIEGRTLDDLLRGHGPMSAEEATHIGVEVCNALAAVHAAGLVHGDVKGSNVMREVGGRIVLMDFSAAINRALPGDQHEGNVSGTPLYMSPEIFDGQGVGVAADIYALGVVLYRLVSGRFPVEGRTAAELMENHRRGRMTPLRDAAPRLPGAFVSVVERALARDPAERFASAGEMERALVQGGGGKEPEPPRPFPWRLAMAGAAAILVAAFTWSLWPRPLEVDASLYRATSDADERLQAGARVAVGDQLFLEIQGSRAMHVYVVDEDAAGRATVLFPVPGLDLKNPLPGKTRHRLPGEVEGISNFWDVTSVGGSERIIVIASSKPMATVEEKLAQIPQAGSVDLGELSQEVARLRGITGISPQVPEPGRPGASPVEGIKQGLSVEAGRKNGLWFYEIHLSNPGRQ
jgi:hypothetical protein